MENDCGLPQKINVGGGMELGPPPRINTGLTLKDTVNDGSFRGFAGSVLLENEDE